MAFDFASGVLGLAVSAGLAASGLAAFILRRRAGVRPLPGLRPAPGLPPGRGDAVSADLTIAAGSPPGAGTPREDLGHHFRTPLNAVLGFCDILLTDRLAPPTPRQARSLGEIRSAGLALLNLVEAEIDQAPTARHAPIPAPVPALEAAAVLPLLRRLCDMRQGAAVASGLDLAPPGGDPELKVLADRIHLRQALQILLDQAMAAAAPGATLLPLVRRERDFVEIAVAVRHPPDLGFCLTAPVHRPFPDDGDELVHARRLAVAMGGRLEARGPGRGDPTLALLLPPAAGAPRVPFSRSRSLAPPATRCPPAAVPRRPVILHIEDEAADAQLMRQVLDRLGVFDLYVAETGRAGLRMADQAVPDVIILDIDLPDLDGWTVKALLADAETTRGVPVVALSAAATADDIRRGLQAGFLDYLTKPLDPALLAMALNRVLGPGAAIVDRPAAPKVRPAA